MNEPQVWAIMGVLAATLVGTLTFVLGQLQRTMTLQFTSLRNEFGAHLSGLRAELDARFSAVDARLAAVDARFDSIDSRLDSLDRDVDALTKHAFGTDRG